MQVDGHVEMTTGPFGKKLLDRYHGRIDTVARVIAVMIVRFAVLPLVTRLDAVLIDKRNGDHGRVLAEPSAGFVLGEDGVHQPFQDVTGDTLAGVMAAGKGEAVLAPTIEPAEIEDFRETPLRGVAEHAGLEGGRLPVAVEKLS